VRTETGIAKNYSLEVRAPKELWEKLDDRVKNNVIAALKTMRTCKPSYSNWLLFSAMTEVALRHMGADWDRMRVDYAIMAHETLAPSGWNASACSSALCVNRRHPPNH
jgi:hypothetical protein